MVKNLFAMHETQVRALGQEDPLEKGMATHSSILAWRIPWTEEAGGLQSVGLQSWTQLSGKHNTRHNKHKDILTRLAVTFTFRIKGRTLVWEKKGAA